MAKRIRPSAVQPTQAGAELTPTEVMQRSGWLIGTRGGESWATGREKPDVRGTARTPLEGRRK